MHVLKENRNHALHAIGTAPLVPTDADCAALHVPVVATPYMPLKRRRDDPDPRVLPTPVRPVLNPSDQMRVIDSAFRGSKWDKAVHHSSIVDRLFDALHCRTNVADTATEVGADVFTTCFNADVPPKQEEENEATTLPESKHKRKADAYSNNMTLPAVLDCTPKDQFNEDLKK